METNQHRLTQLEKDGRLPGTFMSEPCRGWSEATGYHAYRVQCSCGWKEKAENQMVAEHRFRMHQEKGTR